MTEFANYNRTILAQLLKKDFKSGRKTLIQSVSKKARQAKQLKTKF